MSVTDRGLFADPAKKSLLSAAQKVSHLTPAIGTEILGLDLRQLSNTQKDELSVLILTFTLVVRIYALLELYLPRSGVSFVRLHHVNM